MRTESEVLLSPLVLPLFSPEDRINCCAVEILTICERLRDEGNGGLMLAYLAGLIRVARAILAEAGDEARSVRLRELLVYLSEYWSGRSW